MINEILGALVFCGVILIAFKSGWHYGSAAAWAEALRLHDERTARRDEANARASEHFWTKTKS